MSYGTSRLGTVSFGKSGSPVTVAERHVTGIGINKTTTVGAVSVSIGATGLDLDPVVKTITLGGEPLTITNWNSGAPFVDIPIDIALKSNSIGLTLSVTDDTGTEVLAGVTLNVELGWDYVDFSGNIPNPVTTESGYELATVDLALTMVAGDQFVFMQETGLSYDTDTLFQVNPPASFDSTYRVWDVSTNSYSVKTAYSIAQIPVIKDGALIIPLS